MKLSFSIPAAAGLAIMSGIAAAQMPMQDTWDINAPNGEPMQLGAPASVESHGVHGHMARASSADRVIEVGPDTTTVNVMDGETVRFKVGDRSFTWTFEPTLLHTNFGLSRIAPKDMDVHGVRVYCDPTPYERAG